VVEWFVQGLQDRRVEWISALCGHGLDPLFDAADRAGIRIVDVRNEQTAGYMADYWGRLTRRPGVCASSSGVAVANMLTGVMNAWFDGSPVLALSGSADQWSLGLGSFQDSPQVRLAGQVTKLSIRLGIPHRVLELLDQAWTAAEGPEPGPVHVMLPMDIQRTAVAETDLVLPRSVPRPAVVEDITEVQAALEAAERPLILAGSGVYYARESEALAEFATRARIPVQTPIWDRGSFDQAADAFCGVIGAATGGPDLLDQADCVVLAGVQADYRTGYLQASGKRWLRFTRGWCKLQVAPKTGWLDQARAARDGYTAAIDAKGRGQGMHTVDIIDALRSVLPDDAVLILDAGSVGQWAHQLLCGRRYPSYWLTCGRSGVVGYGLGAAMAARLAYPGRAVVLLSGDGSFTFTPAEIECAVRQRLPFTAIVADDRCWGITHSGHLRQFGKGIATQLGEIRFDLLAQSMGARGERINTVERIAPALRECLASNQVSVLHVPVAGGNPV